MRTVMAKSVDLKIKCGPKVRYANGLKTSQTFNFLTRRNQ